ncbi:WYL domain-containing protein [Streptomyces sp. NPDC053741]|uniref:helix-turn-helix transcriptional regulator n=1 Tax=Streptomyces TaxID=1883 RepID=UPI0004BE3F69|nr:MULTISPECIES: WYL domain-containing protein [Streptomyces]MDF9870434.1 putative DNA-binding transcriptional regulator YafY [Streptomyces pratensis]TPM90575.1 WYL domain-containing protein [Mesorhizobium sp. B2-3-3]MCX4411790.1 WYL domain-containing protein [[Kitasatospora] papulosa]QBR08211.1 WYL domain-containing protein [Streptomyces sp. S501]WJY33317.1 WYL domain-containing protein [Streptomyces sp. P9-2B-1]
MKRAERQYALVDLLRGARRPRPAARLADEFGVSPRTIERDIASLQLAGVPIYAEHGATGGYAILREYSLPPLNLSATESLAVLAGLALLDSSPYQAAARRARAKIAAVMEEEHREPVQKMLGMMQVIDAVAPTNDAVPLGMLSDVIADRRVVRLTYLGEDKDGGPDPATSTVRDVETMGLLRAGDAWLLAGWCRLRDAIRGFRIERITELRILDEAPPPRDPALLEADLARWPTRRLT